MSENERLFDAWIAEWDKSKNFSARDLLLMRIAWNEAMIRGLDEKIAVLRDHLATLRKMPSAPNSLVVP